MLLFHGPGGSGVGWQQCLLMPLGNHIFLLHDLRAFLKHKIPEQLHPFVSPAVSIKVYTVLFLVLLMHHVVQVSIISSLRHPNVVMFMGLCLQPPCIVTEFCARGSLFDVLRKARTSQGFAQQLDWSKRLSMALDAAKVRSPSCPDLGCCQLWQVLVLWFLVFC